MKIRCEDSVFDVHRAVVCMRSPVIARAMDDDRWEEAAKGEYHMREDELPIVEAMIYYLYHGTYDDQKASEPEIPDDASQLGIEHEIAELPPNSPSPSPPPSPEPDIDEWGEVIQRPETPPGDSIHDDNPISAPSTLLFNAKVYIIADKYMIPGLKPLANQKFVRSAEKNWNTPEFPAAVELLWENIPESDLLLRDSVIAATAPHLDPLLDRGEFVEFMTTHGDFAVGVMKRRRDNLLIATSKSDQDNFGWGRG
ncbi:hypothetical protein SBOR_2975 [Sclerotinia borealis F-4128]|uniref:BTB domain-containing protein n=1 Tax=Sclerotinia borealis (strain F-4128) TaxID=1432307 RepID=W9CKS4_SCLBF|nr:hypothetical protein SBOR_2975 [Sclerotinia borealis F-4128]